MNDLTLFRRIAARPAIVFEALTTAKGFTAWMGPDDGPVTLAEVDPCIGGAYRVRFRTDDGKEHEASGEFLELNPPTRIAMSWCWTREGEPGEADRVSRIEFDLREAGSGATELTFSHRGLLTAVSAANHKKGWSYAFDKLARCFDGVTVEETADAANQ